MVVDSRAGQTPCVCLAHGSLGKSKDREARACQIRRLRDARAVQLATSVRAAYRDPKRFHYPAMMVRADTELQVSCSHDFSSSYRWAIVGE